MTISTIPISIISFTPVPNVYPIGPCSNGLDGIECGHCDPVETLGAQCGICTWVNQATGIPIPGLPSYTCCTVGGCAQGAVPNDVPIKQLINGESIAPWVIVRFEDQNNPQNYTEITTGNVSQPGIPCNIGPDTSSCCRASVKSFQYGWGTVGSGNKCKLVIADEQGASFKTWVTRVIANPATVSGDTTAGTYKMKVQWGWMIANGCPSSTGTIGSLETLTTGSTPTCGPIPATAGMFYSTDPTTFLSSPPCWFIPMELTMVMNKSGNYVYEIEGVDTMVRASQNASAQVYGNALSPAYFTDAVQTLANQSCPAFSVCYQQLDANGNPEDIQFWQEPDIGRGFLGAVGGVPTVAATDINLQTKGPYRNTWPVLESNPLGAINKWIHDAPVMAASTVPGQRGRGLFCNFDPTYESTVTYNFPFFGAQAFPLHGKMIIWANDFPQGLDRNLTNINVWTRVKALYVVNGGNGSPVLSFSPQIKLNFTVAVKAGGTMGITSGRTFKASNPISAKNNQTACRGFRSTPAPDRQNDGWLYGPQAMLEAQEAHSHSNILGNSIEAELRVQGDPSDWLCTPYLATGRCVSLVVINPFSLDRPTGTDCPVWNNTYTDTCNDILTNRGWYIMGVDHQIKEGSYITILKLKLPVPVIATSDITQNMMAGRFGDAETDDPDYNDIAGELGGPGSGGYIVCVDSDDFDCATDSTSVDSFYS